MVGPMMNVYMFAQAGRRARPIAHHPAPSATIGARPERQGARGSAAGPLPVAVLSSRVRYFLAPQAHS